MEIPFLSSSSSSEDIGVGRNECDLYVMKTVQYVSIDEKIQINQKEWHQATKPKEIKL
jgi:hypothetical protein